jgi:hypothetical protein
VSNITTIREKVLRQLRGLAARFAPNELAYLALTSKVELPVRDKLAFALHADMGNRTQVAREYSLRKIAAGDFLADIAVMDQTGDPVAFVEAKACYVYDLGPIGQRKRYLQLLQSDQRRHGGHSRPVLSLLIATHPLRVIPSNLKNVVKYANLIELSLRWGKDPPDKVLEGVEDKLRTVQAASSLRPAIPVDRVVLEAGEAFGVPVQVAAWLIGPVDDRRIVADFSDY